MVMKEETTSSEIIYNGKVVKLRVDTVELPDMKYQKREIIEHSGGVCVVAFKEDNKILMVKQFRKALERTMLELPAGKLEIGEDPLECAVRELEEETGYKCGNIELLTKFYTSPGFSNELLYVYMATDLADGVVNLDEGEFLESYEMEFSKVVKMVENGEIEDGKTVIGIMMAKNKLGL